MIFILFMTGTLAGMMGIFYFIYAALGGPSEEEMIVGMG